MGMIPISVIGTFIGVLIAYAMGVPLLGQYTPGFLALLLGLLLFRMAITKSNKGLSMKGAFNFGVIGFVLILFGLMGLAGVSLFMIKVVGVIFILFGILIFTQGSNMEGEFPHIVSLGIALFVIGLITVFI